MHPLGLALILLLGLATYLVVLAAITVWMLTHPPRRSYAWAVARALPGDPGELSAEFGGPLEFTTWEFRSRGMSFEVWDISGKAPGGPVVVLTPGWGDSRIVTLPRIGPLARSASRIVVWDLPGHGDSPGTCSLGTREVHDLLALIDTVCGARQPESPSDSNQRVVLFGFSLGAGVSIAAGAMEPRVAGVIAEAPYRVPRDPARSVLSAKGMPWRLNLPLAMLSLGLRYAGSATWPFPGGAAAFDRAAHARRLRVPLLVLHGEHDEVCAVSDGREIAAAAVKGRLAVIANGTHNQLWTNETSAAECDRLVAEFLRDLV